MFNNLNYYWKNKNCFICNEDALVAKAMAEQWEKQMRIKCALTKMKKNDKKGHKGDIAIFIFLLFFIPSIVCAEQIGSASWYDSASCKKEGVSGIYTASGEKFNEEDLTCASWDYPFGTYLRIKNLQNHKVVIVRVNDRGPAKKLYRKGRIIDLSRGAFRKIAPLKKGIIPVRIEEIHHRRIRGQIHEDYQEGGKWFIWSSLGYILFDFLTWTHIHERHPEVELEYIFVTLHYPEEIEKGENIYIFWKEINSKYFMVVVSKSLPLRVITAYFSSKLKKKGG